MDTVTAFAERRQEMTGPAATAPIEANRTLAVTVTHLLSEEGRKASLLTGGDGRAVQELTVDVPVNRLHLVSVDADGVARLKLRPRFELNGEQRVVRTDVPPTYDAPPAIDDLFREAARNHQLERTYETERRAAKVKHREADQERRAQLAKAFLGDLTQRALAHPAPTPKRCWLATDHGRVMFFASTDEIPAREVPLEAHRRFRADLRARREHNQQERAAQLALHEDKKQFIAEWIATHGTPEQQARQAAGVLPMEEAVEAMTDHAFSALRDRPVYARDGVARLQAHLRQFAECAEASVLPSGLVVAGGDAVKATAGQWAFVQDLKASVPDATVTLRVHKLSSKGHPHVPPIVLFGVLVTARFGPFTIRREYAVEEAK
jgi:hypothetical protein